MLGWPILAPKRAQNRLPSNRQRPTHGPPEKADAAMASPSLIIEVGSSIVGRRSATWTLYNASPSPAIFYFTPQITWLYSLALEFYCGGVGFSPAHATMVFGFRFSGTGDYLGRAETFLIEQEKAKKKGQQTQRQITAFT